jgi:uncharacterized membrane protein
MLYLIVLYVYLCLVVAIPGRRSRLGFFRSFALSLVITPVLAAIYIFLFSPARLASLPRSARERLMR